MNITSRERCQGLIFSYSMMKLRMNPALLLITMMAIRLTRLQLIAIASAQSNFSPNETSFRTPIDKCCWNDQTLDTP
jgi:hypothetical protein